MDRVNIIGLGMVRWFETGYLIQINLHKKSVKFAYVSLVLTRQSSELVLPKEEDGSNGNRQNIISYSCGGRQMLKFKTLNYHLTNFRKYACYHVFLKI